MIKTMSTAINKASNVNKNIVSFSENKKQNKTKSSELIKKQKQLFTVIPATSKENK